MKKKIPVLFIHGGMTFTHDRDYVAHLKARSVSLEENKRWSNEQLSKKLGSRFQVIRPRMPQGMNARYRDWKIWFEKYLALLETRRPILIGQSLGGVFLAQYLSENKLKRKALGVYLVAPPFDGNDDTWEDLVGGFRLKKNLALLPANTDHLHIFFSTDDTIVPTAYHMKKYQKSLPETSITILKNRGHFLTPTFPEIVKMIKKDVT
jgi:predicted alpha/beta hydrolase family esterase